MVWLTMARMVSTAAVQTKGLAPGSDVLCSGCKRRSKNVPLDSNTLNTQLLILLDYASNKNIHMYEAE